MQWYWIVLIVVGSLLFVYLFIFSLILFLYSMMRKGINNHPRKDDDDEPYFYIDQKSHDEQVEAIRWMKKESTEVSIKAKDGATLYASLVINPNAKRNLILVHGYRSNIYNDFCAMYKWIYANDCNILCINQRSHGKSDGNWIYMGVRERDDVHEWIEYLNGKVSLPTYLWGVSMGSATVLMSTYKPYHENVKGLIADCGYTSAYDIFAKICKTSFHLPPEPILTFCNMWAHILGHFSIKKAKTYKAIQNTNLPILFVHGDVDDFVPSYMTMKNYESYKGPKDLLIAKGAGHALSSMYAREEYEKKVLELFEK